MLYKTIGIFTLLAFTSRVEGRNRTWAPECELDGRTSSAQAYDDCWDDWFFNTCMAPCQWWPTDFDCMEPCFEKMAWKDLITRPDYCDLESAVSDCWKTWHGQCYFACELDRTCRAECDKLVASTGEDPCDPKDPFGDCYDF